MKNLLRSTSAIVGIFVFLTFGIYYFKEVKKVVVAETSCPCSYDAFGYYMYLPHLANHGNLKMTRKWAQQLQDEYCNGIVAYQLVDVDGAELDVYQMGQAYVEAPAFFIAHGIAKISGYKTDGFSKPYHIALLLNSLLFILLGIVYFRKLCLLFFNDKITALLLALCFIGTNYWIMATLSFNMQHHYLFAILSAFAYFFFKATRNNSFDKKLFVIAVVLFGLAVVMRPTNALLGIVPGLVLLRQLGWSKEFWKRIVWFPIAAVIWNIPQVIYWKTVGGEWFITNLHTEDLTFFDPYTLKFLFSFRKGWLVYTPLFFLLIPAFWALYKRNKPLFYPLLTFTVLMLWTISSWECWWYSDSLSQRSMVDLYGFLFIPMGYLFVATKNRFLKIGLGTFVTLTTLLNIFQSYQMHEGIMHTSRMSKEQYWHIFGKTSHKQINTYRLLIDRGDTTWVGQFEWADDPNFEILRNTWFDRKNLSGGPKKDFSIIHLSFSDLKTDETMITVDMDFEVSDTTQVPLLQLQAAGKYNCYSWDCIEMRATTSKGITHIHHSFNLPDIRHYNDYLQVFVYNPTPASFKIHRLVINTTSLIRK